ncbi:MAG: N-acetylmuramoyl-L-alanine amidase [Alphaproteobacteria bacterium]
MAMKPAFWALAVVLAATAAVAREPRVAYPSVAGPALPTATVVLGARIGEHGDHTRLVLELSDPVKLRVFTLANPDRVIIALPEVLWRLQSPERPSGTGVIKSYRYGSFRSGDSRLVIDLNAPVSPRTPLLLPPSGGSGYRVVVDLYPTSQSQFEQAAGWPRDLRNRPAPEQVATLRGAEPPTPKKKVVVIDPGHGGIDAGTTGIDGSKEKDLVLDEARRLARLLKRRGYIVRLTRDTDDYIPLRERVRIARSNDADLFISLHADSNPNASMAGASVYTLSERGSDREAAALARKENQSDVVAGVDLKGQDQTVSHILIDLAQRETINRSVRFAQSLVMELGRSAGVIARDPHRSAAFAVLKAPDVPAVLIELGYLSNAADCAHMGTTQWRSRVVLSIADAVERQFRPEFAGTALSP